MEPELHGAAATTVALEILSSPEADSDLMAGFCLQLYCFGPNGRPQADRIPTCLQGTFSGNKKATGYEFCKALAELTGVPVQAPFDYNWNCPPNFFKFSLVRTVYFYPTLSVKGAADYCLLNYGAGGTLQP
jgi:hypothetical protein